MTKKIIDLEKVTNKEDSFSIEKEDIKNYKKLDSKNNIILIILSVIFSGIFYFSVLRNYWNTPWISVLLWESIFLFLIFFVSDKKIKIKENNELSFVIILNLLISIWYIIFTNTFFSISFFVLISILNLFIINKIFNKNFHLFGRVFDYLKSFWNLFENSFDIFSHSWSEIKNSFIWEKSILRKNSDFIKNIFIWFIILVLILFIVLPLLASADQIFANYVEKIKNIVLLKDFLTFLTNHIWNSIFILVLSFYFFSFFLFLPNYKLKLSEGKEYKTINNTIISVIIYGLSFVYLLFIIVQFKFIFFGNQDLFKNLDITYASYIHQGFYQLIAITLINYFSYKFFYNRSSIKQNINYKIKFILLLILNFIIVYSALSRIGLYIDAYNLTVLRFFVIYIIFIIMALNIINIVKIITNKKNLIRYFYYIILISFVWFWYFNIENYVANYNINNSKNKLDENYIKNLSKDAYNQQMIIYKWKNVNYITKNEENIKNNWLWNIFYYNYFTNKKYNELEKKD